MSPLQIVKSVDDFILDRIFQPLTYHLQRIAGPSQIALFFLMGLVATIIAGCVVRYQRSELDPSEMILDGAILATAFANYALVAGLRLESRSPNPFRESHKGRLVFGTLLLVALMLDSNRGMLLAMDKATFCLVVCFMYFLACEKPPPIRRKEPKATAAQTT